MDPQGKDAKFGNLVTLTHVMYGLHAFSAFTGLSGAVFIVTAFLTGWPSIIAVIINYVKQRDAKGTFLESHFAWQLRTFWFALLGAVIGLAAFFTVVGIPLAWGIWVAMGIWVLYRIIRGWLALADGKSMPP